MQTAGGGESQGKHPHDSGHSIEFAGIENELFFGDNTLMLFGDAKAMLTSIVQALKED